ncbi:heavy-metal-associated domain-containing protein [Paucisalibacillus globulus]|uniref:heavy-metal-associated domain-containing protein n=1 Tax=Paucisalibacillus globulus TaxID=351095 RepID=UPI000BB9BC4D|nr:heavy metal-associated domain-containing protein [Paucisalibacillus globulus]
MSEIVFLEIKGMHCKDCPKKVERSISKLEGVSKVTVSYEDENGYVTFNSDLLSMNQIISRIKKMGFEANVIKEETIEN